MISGNLGTSQTSCVLMYNQCGRNPKRCRELQVIESQKPTTEMLTQSILDMYVEFWRFQRTFLRILDKLDVGEKSRYRSQFAWFKKKLDGEDGALSVAQITVVNLEGKPYSPGISATPINIDEFEAADDLIVDQTLVPTFMGPGGIIVKTGTVRLRKAKS